MAAMIDVRVVDWSDRPGIGVRRLCDIERDAILIALGQCAGNRASAARALGISRSTLYRKLKAESAA